MDNLDNGKTLVSSDLSSSRYHGVSRISSMYTYSRVLIASSCS